MALTGGGQNPQSSTCVNVHVAGTKTRYPVAGVAVVLMDDGATENLYSCWNSKTIIDGVATPSASGVDRTLNLTNDEFLLNGDTVLVMSESIGTETTTITGKVELDIELGGTAGQRQNAELEFVNGSFILKSLIEIG